MGLVHKAEVSYMNLRTSNKKNSLGRFWLGKVTFLLCDSNSYVSINFKLGKQLTRKNPECWWPHPPHIPHTSRLIGFDLRNRALVGFVARIELNFCFGIHSLQVKKWKTRLNRQVDNSEKGYEQIHFSASSLTSVSYIMASCHPANHISMTYITTQK